jgi:hypothetical protein
MIDPQFALAQAIAHARSQQVMQAQPNMNHPSQIHQIASTLAQRIAGGRAPLGQAHIGMFPQFAPPQNPQQAPQPQQAPPMGYAPDGNPGDYTYTPNAADGDNGFFVTRVHPSYSFQRPSNSLLTPGQMIAF